MATACCSCDGLLPVREKPDGLRIGITGFVDQMDALSGVRMGFEDFQGAVILLEQGDGPVAKGQIIPGDWLERRIDADA